jgi:hypothetical protein
MTFGSTLALKGAMDSAHYGWLPPLDVMDSCQRCRDAVLVFERWLKREMWLQQIKPQNLLDDSYGGTYSD